MYKRGISRILVYLFFSSVPDGMEVLLVNRAVAGTEVELGNGVNVLN